MRDVGRLRADSPAPGLRLWLRPELSEAWSAGLPESGEPLDSSGRGGLQRVPTPLGPALVRTYRRGGLLRRLLPDRFASPGRALAEAAALERLEPLGLAPAVLGLEARGRGLLRLRIAVLEAVGARDLLRLAVERPESLGEVRLGSAVGRALAGMFSAGACHPDLNAANLLVGADGRVQVIDFDGARLVDGDVPLAERERELLRLCRSIDKWRPTQGTSARARAACLRQVLPPDRRRRLLRAGRARHERRRRLGRTGRPRP